MTLVRDYSKLAPADCVTRVTEIQKSLLKYEMQYIRAWEHQERRRQLELEALAAEAERCRQEAEEEGGKIAELHEILGRERRRRKRYEGYEEEAAEVNKKRSRADSQAEISSTKAEIERLRRQRGELEVLAEQRSQRAQLLCHAVAELKTDLKREQDMGDLVLDGQGLGHT